MKGAAWQAWPATKSYNRAFADWLFQIHFQMLEEERRNRERILSSRIQQKIHLSHPPTPCGRPGLLAPGVSRVVDGIQNCNKSFIHSEQFFGCVCDFSWKNPCDCKNRCDTMGPVPILSQRFSQSQLLIVNDAKRYVKRLVMFVSTEITSDSPSGMQVFAARLFVFLHC